MKFIKRAFRIKGKVNHKNGIHGSIEFNAPVYFNGKGTVRLGTDISFGYSLAPKAGNGQIIVQARYKDSLIKIGDQVEFSNNVFVIALKHVSIGNKCLIADFVTIVDSDFHDILPSDRATEAKRLNSDGIISPTIIEDNVWIGSRTIILKGVRIGKDSIIGAGSVVTRNIPKGVIACGVPAKVVRSL